MTGTHAAGHHTTSPANVCLQRTINPLKKARSHKLSNLDYMVEEVLSGLQIRVLIGKLFSLFLIQNICCGYTKEQSQ